MERLQNPCSKPSARKTSVCLLCRSLPFLLLMFIKTVSGDDLVQLPYRNPGLEVDLAPLPASAVVADIVYVPLETRLLAAARARGLVAVDGLGMLLHQARPGFEAWFGVAPQVDQALRDVVAADIPKRDGA